MERLDSEFGRRAIVARASVDLPYVDRLAERLSIHALPTFILFSGKGEVTRLEGWTPSFAPKIEKILSGHPHRTRR